jgi:hypothetical protein
MASTALKGTWLASRKAPVNSSSVASSQAAMREKNSFKNSDPEKNDGRSSEI